VKWRCPQGAHWPFLLCWSG